MSQTDRQRLKEIWEERRKKVVSLETELAELQNQLDSVDSKASSSGVTSGGGFSEYASYRRKLNKSLASITKKLVDAKNDFEKAADRLKNDEE